MEHNGSNATFLDLDISLNKLKFKMFDYRVALSFHIVRIPSVASNIPSIIFYIFAKSKFVRIIKSTLLLKDFLPIAKNLLDRMINRGRSEHMLLN